MFTLKRKSLSAIMAVIAIALLLTGCGSGNGSAMPVQSAKEGDEGLIWSKMPEMSIDLNKRYRAKIDTSAGSFTIDLHAKRAPVTVNNFVFLAKEGFYEGLTFHTVIESFMIQTGDPLGNGTGHAGYRIPDELDTQLAYKEGVVAMFNTGTPDSGSSQFFICTGPDAANLDRQPNYTIFGEIGSGMNVVKAIAATPVVNNAPVEDIYIISVAIEER